MWEFWDIGPYRFSTCEHGDEYEVVRLTVNWAETMTPIVIGDYPSDVTLAHVKAEAARWAIADMVKLKAEAEALL